MTTSAEGKGGSGSSGSSGGRGSSGTSTSGSTGGYGASTSSGAAGAAGYYHGGRDRNYDNDNTGGGAGCGDSCKKALMGVGISLAAIMCGACGGVAFLKKLKKDKGFADSIDEADKEVTESAQESAAAALGGGNNSAHMNQSTTSMSTNDRRTILGHSSVNYVATYNDTNHENGSKSLSCTGEMHFKAIPTMVNCKTIRGIGTDQDGAFSVKQGKIALWTGKAYWVEESTDSGVRSLVRGTFARNPINNKLTFESASFVCTNKATGSFTNFEIRTYSELKDVNLVSDAVKSAMPRAPRFSHKEAFFAYSATPTTTTDNDPEIGTANNNPVECAQSPPSDNNNAPGNKARVPSIFRPPSPSDYVHSNHNNTTSNASTSSFADATAASTHSITAPLPPAVPRHSYHSVPSATATPLSSHHEPCGNVTDDDDDDPNIPTVPATPCDNNLTVSSHHTTQSFAGASYHSSSYDTNYNHSFNNNSSYRNNTPNSNNYDNIPSIFRPPQ